MSIAPPRVDNTNKKSLSFDNTEISFRGKTNTDINRAYWLFKLISINFLTKVGPPITEFALKIGLPLEGIIKATIFKHFCGGETIEECESTVAALHDGKVGAILDYSVEGAEKEEVFDQTCAEIIKTIKRADGDSRIPLTVFKVTGIGRFALLEKVNAQAKLSDAEAGEFLKFKQRFEAICKAAFDAGIPVMVDAEETWIQDSVDELTLEAMRKFNREKLIVYNTYQLYRNDKLASLKADSELAKAEGFLLGAKLVRGAYMEKERERAQQLGYPSPINATKDATDSDYNAAVAYCAENTDHIGFVAGTHNEDSCRLLVELLDKKGIEQTNPNVYFSQLLGMSDNLSFNLADAGYNVAKYVPYGPVKAVLPYLFRRAEENTSISGMMGRELNLILAERKRRKLN
ncbi:MAG TPA: proline dehydrogenase family protein [Daejeonella sp.]|nr:proline dehydrogenase family protein [Daejeonella sp.]